MMSYSLCPFLYRGYAQGGNTLQFSFSDLEDGSREYVFYGPDLSNVQVEVRDRILRVFGSSTKTHRTHTSTVTTQSEYSQSFLLAYDVPHESVIAVLEEDGCLRVTVPRQTLSVEDVGNVRVQRIVVDTV